MVGGRFAQELHDCVKSLTSLALSVGDGNRCPCVWLCESLLFLDFVLDTLSYSHYA
jgi:hypothetical protein